MTRWIAKYERRKARALRNVRKLNFGGAAVHDGIAMLIIPAKIFPHLEHVVLHPLIHSDRRDVYQQRLDFLIPNPPKFSVPTLTIHCGIGALGNPTGPFVPKSPSNSPIVVPSPVQHLHIRVRGFWADVFDERLYPVITFAQGWTAEVVTIRFLGPEADVPRQERVARVDGMKQFLGVTGSYVNHDNLRREWLIDLICDLVTCPHVPKRVEITGIHNLVFPPMGEGPGFDSEASYIVNEVAIRCEDDDHSFADICSLVADFFPGFSDSDDDDDDDDVDDEE